MSFIERILPKLFLFVLLALGSFLWHPNGTTKAAFCSMGFDSYCDDELRAFIDQMRSQGRATNP